MEKIAPQSFKIKVIQEYEVYIYYEQGLYAENKEEVIDIVTKEAIDIALNEEGLVAKLHDETDSVNGYIGYVRSFDPEAKILYNTDQMPTRIKIALDEQGLLNGK